MALTPDTSVQYLKGRWGAGRALSKLNIRTVEDLCITSPELSGFKPPPSHRSSALNQAAAVRGMVVKKSWSSISAKALGV